MSGAQVSDRAARLPRSGVRAAAELARGTPGVLRLDIGDPDFATPRHVAEAVARAAREGRTHYGPGAGLPSLRTAIAEHVGRGGPEEVVVTVGASGGLFCALLALLDPGDEVLVPDPGWSNLIPLALSAGAVPVRYPLDARRGFGLEPDAVAARLGPRTRAVIVNTPGNPTGAVFGRRELAEVAGLAHERGLWLIADECYDALTFDAPHVGAADVSPDPASVVTVRSFSKTYAMTGWRVGYVLAEPAAATAVARAQEATVSCPATPVQEGAEAALAGPQDVVATMRDAYRRRRDAALAVLDGAGTPYVRPRGAFYLLVDVGAAGQPSDAFASRLLAERQVAVVPGSAFGPAGEGFVRVSLAAADGDVAAGVARLAEALVPAESAA